MMTSSETFSGDGGSVPGKIEIQIQDLCSCSRAGSNKGVSVGPVSLNIRTGELLSLVGPAACGRTALIKMIAGIHPIGAGRIFVGGNEVHPPCVEFGLVLARPALLPWRTAMQNILLQAELRGLPQEESRDRARRLMAWFGLSKYEHSMPHDLPPPAAAAVSICRALVHRPAVLLMEEPFANLDPLALELILDAFQRLWAETGAAALLSTGNMQEAVLLGDRVTVMSEPGRILQSFSIELGRPRRMDRAMTPQIAEYCSRIRTSLRAQGVLP